MPTTRSKNTTRKQATRKTRSKAATKRTSSSSRRSAPAAGASGGSFVCPECGKSFTRAAALGAHRSRAHGVAGRTQRTRQSSSRVRATAAASTRPSRGRSIDRDALLAALFPAGIPARERVIRDVNAWLDQAERLARQA